MSNIETVTQNRRWLRCGSAHAAVKTDAVRRSLYRFWKLLVSNQPATNSGLPSRAGHVLAAAACPAKAQQKPKLNPNLSPIIILYHRSNAQAPPLIRQAPAARLALSVTQKLVERITYRGRETPTFLSIAHVLARIGSCE
jgi:hypothetical protein